MPYPDEIPSLGTLEKYPLAVKRWERIYEESRARGYTKERSARIAWTAVKESGYEKKNGKWRMIGMRSKKRKTKKKTKAQIKAARLRNLKKARAALRKKKKKSTKRKATKRKAKRKVAKRKTTKRKTKRKSTKRKSRKKTAKRTSRRKVTVNVYV